MVGTTLTVGLPFDKSQDTAKKINFCENGDGTKGIGIQSKKDKGIVRRGDVEFPCHEIIEPELDPEANADKEDYITSVLSTFEKSLQRTKQNLGTTMKGAIDDVDLVIQTLEECGFQQDRFYIHVDGALYGFMLPLLKGVAPKITFKKPIGSISVSGHKYIGCPMPCGIQMTRIEHIKVLSREVEYIATRDATITCSRSGHTPIFLWYALARKGYNGLKQDFEKCLSNAKYLKGLLKEGGLSVMLNEPSSIVVFEHPRDDDLIRRWQLSCEGGIAHVVVMPSDTTDKLFAFSQDLMASWTGRFRNGVNKPMCVASFMGNRNCVCAKHKDN